jgi:hypothetical protein
VNVHRRLRSFTYSGKQKTVATPSPQQKMVGENPTSQGLGRGTIFLARQNIYQGRAKA